MGTLDRDEVVNWLITSITQNKQELATAGEEKVYDKKMMLEEKINTLISTELYVLDEAKEADGIWMPADEDLPKPNEKVLIWNGFVWNEGVFITDVYPFDGKFYDTGFYVFVGGIGYIQAPEVESWMRVTPPKKAIA